MKYRLQYTRIWRQAPEIAYVKGFMLDNMDWRQNGRFNNAEHFDLHTARYITKNVKFLRLFIKPVNY